MASFHYLLLLLLLFFINAPSSSSYGIARSSFKPKALVLPITKDASTKQHITQIHQRTPLVPLNLVLDLGGQHLWVNCGRFASSSYHFVPCKSPVCSAADPWSCTECNGPFSLNCNNNTCTVLAYNPYYQIEWNSQVLQDILSVQSTNGLNPGRNVAVSRFAFACSPPDLFERLAKGVSGMAGLGRTKIALPSQFSSAFHFPNKFAICLASSSKSKGVVFFGDGPYGFLPNHVDASKWLTYTPLIVNPVTPHSSPVKGKPSPEYFIGVKSIKIDQKVVSNINQRLLSINKKGYGGTKISTVDPYTVLEKSIFKAVTDAFISARNYTRVRGVAPFEVCFDSRHVGSTRLGPAVPTIELVVEDNVSWSIVGANSVVEVRKNVMCLAVVNGGHKSRASIVIGGYQLENHLLQFDLVSSKLGFSSALSSRMTSCGNFNFTSTAV